MRCLIRENDQWRKEKPEDLEKWLMVHDGDDAVVIDDGAKLYYCATESLRDEYQSQGKTALMFYDLGAKLHSSSPAVDPSLNNPFWCATYAITCSAADECTDDCCYQPRGGK